MRPVRDPNLVLWLPLYQIDGSSFMSRDAYGHLCTPSPVAGMWTPQGWVFDGVDDYIDTGWRYDLAADDFTLLGVVKPGVTPDKPWLTRWKQGSSSWDMRPGFSVGSATSWTFLYSTDGANQSISTGPAFISEAFQQVGLVRISGVAYWYLSGRQTSSEVLSATIFNGTGNVLLNKWVGWGDACGNHSNSEIALYNRGLTPQEIGAYYLDAKRRMPWLT